MLNIEKLSYADVMCGGGFMVEIIPHQGVEIGAQQVREYNAYISQLDRPTGVLFNRAYGFSFAFDSLQKIVDHPSVVAVAFLATERYAYSITETDISHVLNQHKPIDVFYDKLIASIWFNMLRLRLPDETEHFTGRNSHRAHHNQLTVKS